MSDMSYVKYLGSLAQDSDFLGDLGSGIILMYNLS